MAVLSIQSHVVYGYAGNTAAVFPLQRLGNTVWAVNTVEFSNHTGYGSWKGKVLGAELVSDLVTGLEERCVLNNCDAVLSGYLGDAQVGKAIIDTVKKVKKYSPNALYCCDPVMGDTGRGFYVKPDIPGMFKNELIPLADIVCPNQFELEALTNVKIENFSNLLKAINILHDMGPQIVLVTSFIEKHEEIGILASRRIKSSDGTVKTFLYKVTTPFLQIENNVAGTGDMTTSIFLSYFLKTRDIEKTLSLCVSSVYGILEASYKNNKEQLSKENDASLCMNKLLELDLIDSQDQLINPSNSFKAIKINEYK